MGPGWARECGAWEVSGRPSSRHHLHPDSIFISVTIRPHTPLFSTFTPRSSCLRNFLVPSLLFILIFWVGILSLENWQKKIGFWIPIHFNKYLFSLPNSLSGTTLAAAAESKCITPSSVALHALMTFLTASLNVYTTQWHAFTKRGMSRYFRMGHFKRTLSGLPSMPLWSSHWTACRNGAGGCWKDRGGPFWDPHSNALNVTIVRRRERITVFNQLIQHEESIHVQCGYVYDPSWGSLCFQTGCLPSQCGRLASNRLGDRDNLMLMIQI